MAKERPPLEEMTLRQLRIVASGYNISRYSRMRKVQLLTAIQKIETDRISHTPSRTLEAQEAMEASKFGVSSVDRTGGALASVDEGLPELPDGYGESRIVMMPRDPQWSYAYWDIPNEHKEALRHRGGQQIALGSMMSLTLTWMSRVLTTFRNIPVTSCHASGIYRFQ